MSDKSRAPLALAITARDAPVRLHLHDRSETISNHLRSFRIWQPKITMFLINYLRDGDVFVDAGANLGYFSVYAGICVGRRGTVHAIEPDAENAQLLEKNLALNRLDNVQVHRTAIADYSGDATLYRGDFNAGAHSIVETEGLSAGPRVPVTTLDRLLASGPTPRLVKIDVQGAELPMLRGMAQMLAAANPKPAILMEFAPADLQRRDELETLFSFIADHRYRLSAFIANERLSLAPTRLRRTTLRSIAEDVIRANDKAEFDLLLVGAS